VTDFDPVAHALANPSKTRANSKFMDPRVTGWLEAMVKAYEEGTIKSWDWPWVARILRDGDPTLPKEHALREYVKNHRTDLWDRIIQAR
jgi:hypothetical protein